MTPDARPTLASETQVCSRSSCSTAFALYGPPAPPAPTERVVIVDPREDKRARRLQKVLHDIRVNAVRAYVAAGNSSDGEAVSMLMTMIDRSERQWGSSPQPPAGETVYKHARTANLQREAQQTARALMASQRADHKVDIGIKIMLIGMIGTGKSQLANALLDREAARVDTFGSGTQRVQVHRGAHRGLALTVIDTPGLYAAGTCTTRNMAILRSIKAAYTKHKPTFVFYVDRHTHTHPTPSPHPQLNPQLQQKPQVMLVDTHPDCPTSSQGNAVVTEQGQALQWKVNLVTHLMRTTFGTQMTEIAKQTFGIPAKPKVDKKLLFHQKGHGSLPSAFFFVEQLSEGVLKPEGSAPAACRGSRGPRGRGMYYTQMFELAQAGDPWAAREYDAMLRKERRYCAEVVDNVAEVELETKLKYGLAGRLSGAQNVQTTFDPEDMFTSRMLYPLERSLIACQPVMSHHTQGTERQDGINAVHLMYKGQPFNRSGYGGFPADVSMYLTKDKKQLSMQAEGHASIVHSLPPFSKTHVTQVNASCELQRPDMEEVMYTLEVNTFKDGLLGRNDHAGCGFLFSKCVAARRGHRPHTHTNVADPTLHHGGGGTCRSHDDGGIHGAWSFACAALAWHHRSERATSHADGARNHNGSLFDGSQVCDGMALPSPVPPHTNGIGRRLLCDPSAQEQDVAPSRPPHGRLLTPARDRLLSGCASRPGALSQPVELGHPMPPSSHTTLLPSRSKITHSDGRTALRAAGLRAAALPDRALRTSRKRACVAHPRVAHTCPMADSPLKLSKGPVALGLRVQDTFRLGAFRVEAVASRATAQVAAAGAPPEVGWGGRAHVAYDHLPGVGMNFDFFQQENKEGEGYLLRGLASNLTYDFEALGAILGVEVDLPGDEAAHVSMSIFSGNDYKFCWLLVIPAWNLISERVAGLFRRGGGWRGDRGARRDGVEGRATGGGRPDRRSARPAGVAARGREACHDGDPSAVQQPRSRTSQCLSVYGDTVVYPWGVLPAYRDTVCWSRDRIHANLHHLQERVREWAAVGRDCLALAHGP
ncbi:MAG: hypothetical protein WDW38_010586 [Sanguina aurantia]